MNRLSLLFLMPFIALVGTGCLESQGGPDRLAVMEQRHAELEDAFDTDHARVELSTMKIKNLEKGLQLLDERLNTVVKRLDTLAKAPESLAADLDQNKVYLKSVRDDLHTIRSETAEVVRIQNQSISQGRQIYALILQREIDTLATRLAELNQTMQDLKAEDPQIQNQLEQAANIIEGKNPPPP
ncbi:MAG: hypothetical protein MI892_29390, partial [Desulfobacterales bacterium]|nr:hypothetical protein [Desulfobacterales bacterium]